MIKIEKNIALILAIEDPEIEKLRDQLIVLSDKFPEIKNAISVVSINKLSKDGIEYIKKFNKVAIGKEEAKLPIFVLKINAYTNDIDEFLVALKDLNFTNKKSGLVMAFLGIEDPDIKYQIERIREIEYLIGKEIQEGTIFAIVQVVDFNDVESSKKLEQYIKELNKKIYNEEGLKLPVFGIFFTYCTNNIVEFESFLNYINKLT